MSFNLKKVLKVKNENEQIRFYFTDSSYYLTKFESKIDAERITKSSIHLKAFYHKKIVHLANNFKS